MNRIIRKTVNAMAVPMLVMIILTGMAAAETAHDKVAQQALYALDQSNTNDLNKHYNDGTKGNWNWLVGRTDDPEAAKIATEAFEALASLGCLRSSWALSGDGRCYDPDIIKPVSFYSQLEAYGDYSGIGRGGQCYFFANLAVKRAGYEGQKNVDTFMGYSAMLFTQDKKKIIGYVKPGDVIYDPNKVKNMKDAYGNSYKRGYPYTVALINSGDSNDGTVTSIQARDRKGATVTISKGNSNNDLNLDKYVISKYARGIEFAQRGDVIFDTKSAGGSDHTAIVVKITSGNSEDGTVDSLDVVDSNFVGNAKASDNNEIIGYHIFDNVVDPANTNKWYLRQMYVYAGTDYYSENLPISIPPPSQKLSLLSPNGGEVWPTESTQTIKWKFKNTKDVSTVAIDLYMGDIRLSTIKYSAPTNPNGEGSYAWNIPLNYYQGIALTMRVTSNANPKLSDSSDNHFSIVQPSITVTSPNGGENWDKNPWTFHEIKWTYVGNTGSSVKIKLVSDSATYLLTESAPIGTDGKGSYLSSLPLEIEAGSYAVRITSNERPEYWDTSNSHFTISETVTPTPTPTPTPTATPTPTLEPTPTPTPSPTTFNKIFSGNNSDWLVYSSQQTSDNGYILAGENYLYNGIPSDALLIKIDSSGNESWNKTFGGDKADWIKSVRQTSDGGYILAGVTESVGNGDAWLIKIDSSGNESWNKTFDGGNYDEAYSVQQTFDGGYILAGRTYSYSVGYAKVLLVKTDPLGNELWRKTFDGEEVDYIQQTPDEGYIFTGVGYDGTGGYDAWLVKTDSSGNELWNKSFGGINFDQTYSFHKTSDNGYILAGFTRSFGNGDAGNTDVWLIKTDSSGNEMWNKTFGGIKSDIAYSVWQNSDGTYILAGLTKSLGAGGSDAWLIKTDSSGNELWNKTFGGLDYDEADSIQQTLDGGYIFAGFTESYSAGTADAWLVKIDQDGNI